MRIRLLREGVETVDGRVLEPGSTALPTFVPVLNTERNFVAVIEKIRREAGGWVTGDINTPRARVRGFAAMAEIEIEEQDEESEAIVVTKGLLKAVVMGHTPAWPGMMNR